MLVQEMKRPSESRRTPPDRSLTRDRITLFPNDEEAHALERLRIHRPDLVVPFLEHLRLGRRGILLRLFQSVVRENLASEDESSEGRFDDRTIRVRLADGRELHASVVRRMALGRFDIEGPITLIDSGHSEVIDQPGELLDLLDGEKLLPEGDADARRRFVRFRKELENSAVNLGLAFAASSRRREALAQEAAQLKVGTTLQYVRAREAIDPSFSPLAFFEQWVIEGHPLHPGARMKMGMETEDVVRNAPEWGARLGIALVAVAKTACRVNSRGSQGTAELLAQEYPALVRRANQTLTGMGKAPEEYEFVPVHPWQLTHTLPTLHAGPIQHGEVVPLPECTIPAHALISVRSFAPVQRRGERKHHLKTAINVHMTSAVRTVSPNAVENGPTLSRVLAEIQQRESDFGGQFAAVLEDVGIHYRSRDKSLDRETAAAQNKHLAAMFRENPENHVREGEFAMPAAALTARSPLGSGPIVAELIDAYAEQHGLKNRHEAAARFLRRYVEVSVPGFLTMMTRYGIALEGHMQNSVCVFRDGELSRMLVRDLGAVRIVPERLAQEQFTLELLPGSAILADDVDDMRNKLYYSFFQNHLAELIVAIVRHLNVDERSLWREVAAVSRQVFAALKSVKGLEQVAADDEDALFCPMLSLKALATMRLRDYVTDYAFAKVPNPLADCGSNTEECPQ